MTTWTTWTMSNSPWPPQAWRGRQRSMGNWSISSMARSHLEEDTAEADLSARQETGRASWLAKLAETVHLWLPALIGTGVVLYATVLGPWVHSDSVEFIVSARNLLSGGGLGGRLLRGG